MPVERRLSVSLAAVLCFLCLYYRGGLLLLPTVLLPVAAHELAHLLALWALGFRVTRIALEPRGLCIRYTGCREPRRGMACALAGPLGGALYAFVGLTGVAWLEQSAGLSLLLTAFNLLPIPPLDGGRIFAQLCVSRLGAQRGVALCRAVSRTLLALFLLAGVALALWKQAGAPLAAGIWLLLIRKNGESEDCVFPEAVVQ